jgi:hypothetical protein
LNYEAVKETIKAGYREITSQYRRGDEIEVTSIRLLRANVYLADLQPESWLGRHLECLAIRAL